MEKATKSDILLETGTNELEIVVFRVANEYYGINVAKVREIIRTDIAIVPLPDGNPSILGVVNLRGKIIPVVDLAKHLNITTEYDKKSRIIITEFNQMLAGFKVNEVNRIHRISWKQVESPSGLLNTKASYAVGVVKIEDKVLFLLDFERIASIINPESGLEAASRVDPGKVTFDRSKKKVFLAEDSPFIRDMLIEYIKKAGYQYQAFQDGEEAWQAINAIISSSGFNKLEDHFHLLITDIEMPRMDGLHLVKRIRETQAVKNLPCIVFSSMISEELSHKCKSIGVTDQITKPQINYLIQLVDKHAL